MSQSPKSQEKTLDFANTRIDQKQNLISMAQSDSEQPLFSGNLVWKLTDIGEQIYCEVLQKESELREQESGPMEDMIWKFPHIGEQIFKKLGNKNLAKCKKVGKTWGLFISNQKFYQQRVKYEKMQKNRDNLMD